MWVLMGEIQYANANQGESYRVALFTSRDKAYTYLESAKLKNPTYHSKFKRRSLLSAYDHAWVDEEYEETLPVDPDPVV